MRIAMTVDTGSDDASASTAVAAVRACSGATTQSPYASSARCCNGDGAPEPDRVPDDVWVGRLASRDADMAAACQISTVRGARGRQLRGALTQVGPAPGGTSTSTPRSGIDR